MIQIESLFLKEKIEYFSIIPIEKSEVINSRLMPKGAKTAIVFLIPYRTSYEATTHLAQFARIRDYHSFSKELFSRLLPQLEKLYPQNSFWGFADHSPINERKLAHLCGLGDLGMNGLLINEKYGSYVFIGEILTTAVFDTHVLPPKKLCNQCGECIKNCPRTDACISEISQKKRKTEEDFWILKKLNVVWGCDKCQEKCPQNENSALSPFEHFFKGQIHFVEEISDMTDEEFSSYPFSYRGRQVIEENIKNIFKKDID